MDILSSMISILSQISVYKPIQGSIIHSELMAYAEGFDIIVKELHKLLNDFSVETCSPERLKKWEKLLNIPFSKSVPIETRREIVLYKLAVAPNDFYPEGMINSIRYSGVNAEIIENTSEQSLLVKFLHIFGQSDNLDIIKRQIYDILPAHLSIEFDMGTLTWEEFEAKDYSFEYLDSKDFTWEYFDLSGALI